MAVAERVDVVDGRKKKKIKKQFYPSNSPSNMCSRGGSDMALKRKRTTTRRRKPVK